MFIVKKFTQRDLASQVMALALPAGAGRHMGNGEPMATRIMKDLALALEGREKIAPSVLAAVKHTCVSEVRFVQKLTEPERGILEFYAEEEERVIEFVEFMVDLWSEILRDAPLSARSRGAVTYKLKLIALLPAHDLVQSIVEKSLKRSVDARVDLGAGMAEMIAANMAKQANLPIEDIKQAKLVWPKDMRERSGVDIVRAFLDGTPLGTWLASGVIANVSRRVVEVARA